MLSFCIVDSNQCGRNRHTGKSASLDDLRGGRGGEAQLRDDISSASLFTNAYLPTKLLKDA